MEITQSPNFPSKRTPQAEELSQEQAQSTERILDVYTKYKNAELTDAGKKEFFKDFPEYEETFKVLDAQPAPFDIPYEERAQIEGALDPTKMAPAFEKGWSRDILKNVSPNSLADTVTFLRKNVPDHTFITYQGVVWSRPTGSSDPWRPMDPGLLDSIASGDIFELVKETGRDVREALPDILSGALKEGAGLTAAGATAATTFNPFLTGAAYVGTKAGLSAGEEALRQKLGQYLGVNPGGVDLSKVGIAAGTEGVLAPITGGLSPGQFMSKGTVPQALKNKIWEKVAAKSGLTRTQFDLLPEQEVAQMGSQLFQGLLGKGRQVVGDFWTSFASGQANLKNPNALKAYIESDKGKIPLTEDAKKAVIERIQKLGTQLKGSAEEQYKEAYKKATDVIGKEGVDLQEAYHVLRDLYVQTAKAAHGSSKAPVKAALAQDARDITDVFSYMVDENFAKRPRGAFVPAAQEAIKGKPGTSMFFDAMKGQYVSEAEAARSGAFMAKSQDLSKLAQALDVIRGKSWDPRAASTSKVYSPEVQGQAKLLQAKLNELMPSEQRAADELYKKYMNLVNMTEPVTGIQTKLATSAPKAESFVESITKAGSMPKAGMQEIAETAMRSGKPMDRAAYQEMSKLSKLLTAADLEGVPKFWNLHNPQAVVKTADIGARIGGKLANALEAYGTSGVGPVSEDPLQNLTRMLLFGIGTGGGRQANQKQLMDYMGYTAPQADTLDPEELKRIQAMGAP